MKTDSAVTRYLIAVFCLFYSQQAIGLLWCFTVSRTGPPLMAHCLQKRLKHVVGERGEAVNRLQIRSHQGKWDRRKQAENNGVQG